MNVGNDERWKSCVPFVALLMMISSLVACGDRGEQIDPAANSPVPAADAEATEKYREKVKRRVSASVVSSISREWGVPEAKVECALADLSVSQLDDAATDATVAAVFDRCGLEPKVAD